MIQKQFLFPESAKTKLNLYILSDIHFGSNAFSKEEYERISDTIKRDPDAYTLILGDVSDDDRPSTRMLRRSMFNDRIEAFQQEDKQHLDWLDRRVLPELAKIAKAGRCLGVLDGDHYRKYSNGLTSVQYACSMLKLPYLGDGQAIVELDFTSKTRRGETFRIHAQHGVGGTGRSGNGVNKLEDVANQWEGIHCFCRGHNHKAFIYPISRYVALKTISKKDVWLINTPSFRTGIVEGITDYAEAKCYGATPFKFPVLKIRMAKPFGGNYQLVVSGELI